MEQRFPLWIPKNTSSLLVCHCMAKRVPAGSYSKPNSVHFPDHEYFPRTVHALELT